MKAKKFDTAFDRGEDITGALYLAKVRRPLMQQYRVGVDLPIWMIDSLNREANRLGVTRRSIIEAWLAERLQKVGSE